MLKIQDGKDRLELQSDTYFVSKGGDGVATHRCLGIFVPVIVTSKSHNVPQQVEYTGEGASFTEAKEAMLTRAYLGMAELRALT